MAAGSDTLARISGRQKPSPMACPNCGSSINGVVETKTQADNSIRRRRRCATCEHAWTTVERALDPIQEGDTRLRPERLRTLADDGFLGGRRVRGHGAVVPLPLYFPWLTDEERDLLQISRRMRPEDRRLFAELLLSLQAGSVPLPSESPTPASEAFEYCVSTNVKLDTPSSSQ